LEGDFVALTARALAGPRLAAFFFSSRLTGRDQAGGREPVVQPVPGRIVQQFAYPSVRCLAGRFVEGPTVNEVFHVLADLFGDPGVDFAESDLAAVFRSERKNRIIFRPLASVKMVAMIECPFW
jgi:hypothetical protein